MAATDSNASLAHTGLTPLDFRARSTPHPPLHRTTFGAIGAPRVSQITKCGRFVQFSPSI